MNSNFEFLKKDWEILFKIGEMAEYTLYKDPNTALIKMRQLGEYLVKSILKVEKIYDEKDSNQKKKILRLREEDLITEKEASILNALREIGNKAVHSAYDDKTKALELLPKVVELCSWFNEVYGSDYNFNSEEVTYQKPLEIDYQKAYESLKKKFDEVQAEKEFSHIQFENLNIKPKEERKKIYQKRKEKGPTEAETRFIIDTQLREAGWEVDTPKLNYKINKTLPESKRYMAIAEWPCIKEDGEKGYVDYALFYEKTLIGVIEAKRYSVDVGSALRRDGLIYAKGILNVNDDIKFLKNSPFADGNKVQFIFASNGRGYNKEWIDKSGIWFLNAKGEKFSVKALHNFYSPKDLMEISKKDNEKANEKLKNESIDYLTSKDGLNLRYYQLEAVQKVEKALINGQHKILLTMATGTGKTRTALAILYRLLESDRYKRILFLVDRATLGEQAMDTFTNAKIKQQSTLTSIYEVLGLQDKNPNDETRVHIATVQGLINRVLYSDNPLSVGKYDCIIIDEAHRGYTLDRTPNEDEAEFRDEKDYQSKYRYVIDYFDADKIALTATPALHTYEIFGEPVYQYSYRKAVLDGYLVDFEPKRRIYTELNTKGINYKKGDEIKVYDKDKEIIETKVLADEISFDIEDFNKKVIVESFNRVVCQELVKEIDPEGEGKTLIFATTDEHADMIVRLLEEEYEKSNKYEINSDMIKKITGSVKDVSKLISKYKNEQYPTIAVTVDLLTTGVDVPKIVNLVFLRKVKSRILYEQMIGRATRRCDEIGKEYFTIYDPVGICEDLEKYTDMKPVVKNIDYQIKNLFKELENSGDYKERKRYYADNIIARLQRKRKKIEAKGDVEFKSYSTLLRGSEVENINKYLEILKDKLETGNVEDIEKEKDFLIYLDQLKFGDNKQVVSEVQDRVIKTVEDYGDTENPSDYLEGFTKYINENKDKIQALNIYLTNPKLFTRKDLKTIKILLDGAGYKISNLEKAYSKRENKCEMTLDIMTFINNAIKGSPIKEKSEKARDVENKIKGLYNWDSKQLKIINTLVELAEKNDFITEEDFKEEKVKHDLGGGYKKIDGKLEGMLEEILNLIKDEMILN